eukprot:15365375-Ditylum_brightwellii.AAC.2
MSNVCICSVEKLGHVRLFSSDVMVVVVCCLEGVLGTDGSLDTGSLETGSLGLGSLEIGSLGTGSLDMGSLGTGSLDSGVETVVVSGVVVSTVSGAVGVSDAVGVVDVLDEVEILSVVDVLSVVDEVDVIDESPPWVSTGSTT